MKKKLLQAMLLLMAVIVGRETLKAQSFPYECIMQNGSPSSKVNLVFVGDGYRSHQMNDYISDVTHAVNGMFREEPFKSLKNKFNVIAIKVPSNAEGAASDPSRLIDNYFGSTYNYSGIQRLLVATKSNRISSVLNNSFSSYDQGVVIVNDDRYGGSGGRYAVFSTASSAIDLCIHELGHSYADLADEYWYRAQEKANQTADNNRNTIRWRQFLGQGGVGIYQYESPGSNYYRPHQNCMMRYLGSEFCAVCENHIIKVTNDKLGGGGGGDDLAVPGNLRTSSVGSTSVTVAWNSVSGATGYNFQTWDGSQWVNYGNTSSSSYTLSGFSKGSTVYVRMRAYNSSVYSDWTAHITVDLKSTGGNTPAVPKNLQSYNVGPSSFGVYWSLVDGADQYDVQTWNGSNWVDHGNTNEYYYWFSNMSAGYTYYVRVRSRNGAGSSEYTDYITVTLSSSKLASPIVQKGAKITLHPNPVTNFLHIDGLQDEVKAITIVNAYGAFVFKNENVVNQEVDLSGLKPGVYILSITFEGGESINKKIIKK